MSSGSGIGLRLERMTAEIAHLASEAGRPGGVRLIAVSKTMPANVIREAYDAGQRLFGENRVQEAVKKIPMFPLPGIEWHMIGHLQTNKARQAVEAFQMIESLDSTRLARALDARAEAIDVVVPVLVEVNVAREASKSGASPEDVEHLVRQLQELPRLALRGLMTVAPLAGDPEEARPVFRQLRHLRDELRDRMGLTEFTELSMGMSGDYGVAIQEGSTCVRLGRAIFGERRG